DAVELCVTDAAGLVAPRPHRVEACELQRRRRAQRLGRLPLPLELPPRGAEAGGNGVRDVVVARNGDDGRAERAEERRGALVLLPAAAMGQIAGREHEVGL